MLHDKVLHEGMYIETLTLTYTVKNKLVICMLLKELLTIKKTDFVNGSN